MVLSIIFSYNVKKFAIPEEKEGIFMAEIRTETFVFPVLPASAKELMTLPESSLDTPYKAAALTVLALAAYAEDKDAGIEMLNALKGPQPLTPFEKQFLTDRFRDVKYVPLSYFEGASPENSYTPAAPYRITVSANPYSFAEENYAVLYLRSGGADSPRSVKLRRKGEQWFLWEQFLLAGIRQAKKDDPWA